MTDFQTSIDIANRALQHVGASRITAFTDDSKNAAAVAFCYDKLRKAELRRNVWRFAIRRVALRPVSQVAATLTTLFTPDAWAIGTTYAAGAIVSYLGRTWESTAAGNVGLAPNTDGNPWELYCGPRTIQPFDATIAWFAGELVLSGGLVYRSLISNNSDVPPTANWLAAGGTSGVLSILYPIGSGPLNQATTKNVFRLPSNFLREAPQDPRAGSTSSLGAPSGLDYGDNELENDFIVSSEVRPIVYRFVPDIFRVTAYDGMFSEGLAARIALEVCEELTQSAEKMQTIGASYNRFMGEARTVNGIETGSSEPPEDDYISCRA